MAYMRVLAQPADDLAFERIVNVPKRGLGDTAMRAMHAMAREERIPLAAAADPPRRKANDLRSKPRQALAELMRGFARWREMLPREGHVVTAATVLDESGYTEMWKQDKSPEAPGRLDNLKEFLRAMGEFESLAGFLEHVALVMENGRGGRAGPRVADDAARGEGAGIRHGVPAGLGGRDLPVAAQPGRRRREGAGGGAPARLCRADARARQARHRQQRREPAASTATGPPPSPAASSTSCRPSRCSARAAPPSRAAGWWRSRASSPASAASPRAAASSTRAPGRCRRGPRPPTRPPSASACSTRNSATARCWRRTTTSSTWSSRRPAGSAC